MIFLFSPCLAWPFLMWAFLATPTTEFPAKTFTTNSNLCLAVQSRFAELCFNPQRPRLSNAFTQALTWFEKGFASCGRSKISPYFIILENAIKSEFPILFHEKYPFPGFAQD